MKMWLVWSPYGTLAFKIDRLTGWFMLECGIFPCSVSAR